MQQHSLSATTPADLGPRAALLVEKHAEYIKGFVRIWEVRRLRPAAAIGRCSPHPARACARTLPAACSTSSRTPRKWRPNPETDYTCAPPPPGLRPARGGRYGALLDERHVLGPHRNGAAGAARRDGHSSGRRLGAVLPQAGRRLRGQPPQRRAPAVHAQRGAGEGAWAGRERGGGGKPGAAALAPACSHWRFERPQRLGSG